MKNRFFILIASLFLCGSIFAQENHFPVTPNPDQGDNIQFWCEVLIDDVQQTSESIEIGMFVDGVCRDSKRIDNTLVPSYSLVRLYTPLEVGTFTFQLYDHDTKTELRDCSYSYTIDNIGQNPDPIIIGTDGFVQLNFTSPEPVGPEYPWIPNANTNDNVALFSVVQINGVNIVDGDQWTLGAFVGDECVGVVDNEILVNNESVQWTPAGNAQFPYPLYAVMTILGNVGDEVSFKLYDKNAGAIFEGVCEKTIIIEEGEDVIGSFRSPEIFNFVTTQTFTLPITGYGNENNYFYLISSPIGEIAPNNVEFMLTENVSDFDLYYFDQAASDGLEWINYKDATDGNFNLVPGKGYLYANKNNVTLSFTGIPYSGTAVFKLAKDAGENTDSGFEGWNLMGNPFPNTVHIDHDFYIMNGDGSEIILSEESTIEPMNGFFVIAQEDNEDLLFSNAAPAQEGKKIVLNISGNRNNLIDRAMIRFDEGRTLPKIMLNGQNSKLYFPLADADYAVVSATEEVEEIPVSFEPASNGTYTLTVNTTQAEMQYIRLLDSKTGAVVDMLDNPSYTFDANANDPANRFTLSFKANSNVNVAEVNNPIHYNNNGLLTINDIEGELQVIDMLGRVISSNRINGSYSQILNNNSGVYVIRVVSDKDTYTRKIVVE